MRILVRKPVILIQEPDEGQRRLILDYYAEESPTVQVVDSRAEALELCRQAWYPVVVLYYERRPSAAELDQDDFTRGQAAYTRIINCRFESGFIGAERKEYESKLSALKILLSDRGEGLDYLHTVIKHALNDYLPIVRPSLRFFPRATRPVTFAEMISWLEPGLEGVLFLKRCQELEDVFRLIFTCESAVELQRLLWHYEGRVALVIRPYPNREAVLLVAGRREEIEKTVNAYKSYAPDTPDESQTFLTDDLQCTTHYAGIVYRLGGHADLSSMLTLSNLYQAGRLDLVDRVFEYIVNHSLHEWAYHENGRWVNDVNQIYRGLLKLPAIDEIIEMADKARWKIVSQAEEWGINYQFSSSSLTLHFPEGEKLSIDEPFRKLRALLHHQERCFLLPSPGRLTGDTLLTTLNGKGWFTDYYQAGMAPAIWPVATLEADIRYDWPKHLSPEELLRLELELIDPVSCQERGNCPASIRNQVNIILNLRSHALKTVKADSHIYPLAMLHLALQRMAQVNHSPAINSEEVLSRSFQALLTVLLTCQYLVSELGESMTPELPTHQMTIKEHPGGLLHTFFIDGVELKLTDDLSKILFLLWVNKAEQGESNRTSFAQLYQCLYSAQETI